MVEFEECGQWYHYTCILARKVKVTSSFTQDQFVTFICGLHGFTFSEGVLLVKGSKYLLKQGSDFLESTDSRKKHHEKTKATLPYCPFKTAPLQLQTSPFELQTTITIANLAITTANNDK